MIDKGKKITSRKRCNKYMQILREEASLWNIGLCYAPWSNLKLKNKNKCLYVSRHVVIEISNRS